MATATDIGARELDHRSNDGIDVTLLWNSQTNRVFVAVEDERHGELFEFQVAGADALEAFRHPYAHATERLWSSSAPVQRRSREQR